MTTTIDQRIDALESRFAMLDLTSDYCLGFDKHDFERFMGIWWDDAVWEVGPPFGRFEGRAGIARALEGILWPAWAQSTHYNTNLRIVPDGSDAAKGVSDVYCIGNTSDGQSQTVAATYTDRFERRGGEWKIALRQVKMHHFSPLHGITLTAP